MATLFFAVKIGGAEENYITTNYLGDYDYFSSHIAAVVMNAEGKDVTITLNQLQVGLITTDGFIGGEIVVEISDAFYSVEGDNKKV